ncbi:MAG: hypothetical protein JW927_06640 [Deltaproteobacteria bacterium]|nr:hypothetical protein [Deltaproteobacteria bacterium]
MISSSYDITEFVVNISDKGYFEILQSADKEATEVERTLYKNYLHNDPDTSTEREYAESLKGLICFLTNTVDPFERNDLNSGLFKQLLNGN